LALGIYPIISSEKQYQYRLTPKWMSSKSDKENFSIEIFYPSKGAKIIFPLSFQFFTKEIFHSGEFFRRK